MAGDHPYRLASSLEERFRSLETEFHRAYWDSQVDATPANDRRRADLELELRRLKGDADALARVEQALADEIHDPVLKRRLEVLRLSLLGNQMDESRRARLVTLSTAIESDFANYRPVVDGKQLTDNEIEEILKNSNNERERRAAWGASKEIGRIVADRVVELARIRNQVAQERGFADYYQFALELQEMSAEWLFGVMDELERLTEEPFRLWKADLDERLSERFGTRALSPWHYADPFFQTPPPDGAVDLDDLFSDRVAPELALKTFQGWGIDISAVIAASDLYPRKRKSQHAFCIHIDRLSDDVRILANIVPGERWVEVMLHESGHAAYDVSLDPDLPYSLRRAAHTFVTEGIALLSGRLVHHPRWLGEIAGVDGTRVESLGDALLRASAAQMLLFARWALVVVHFEREFYADPEADHNARWWELVERFQLVSPPPDRDQPDWAAKVHIASAPVYYHNYLLGDLLAAQLEATCEQQCGGLVGVPEAGQLLTERVFRSGALLPWYSLVEEATGGRLSAAAFAAAVAI